jgi:hypothetical protein
MIGHELTAAMDALGLRGVDLALLLGRHPQSISNWAKDRYPVPGDVAAFLEAFGELPRDRQAAMLARKRAERRA